MEWLKRLNLAIGYLEENLAEEIHYEEAAKLACCSTFHFQRMFSYLAEVPLSEYIRRRRMTVAAFELMNTDEKVIDIAMKYGYDSPTAFNRAFQSIHGVSPSEARKKSVSLKAYPRISFQISIKGEKEMNYKIEKKDAFRIVGVKERFSMNVEEGFAKVPLFWKRTIEAGLIPELCKLIDKEPAALLGISSGMDGKEFDYFIAAVSDKEIPQGMEESVIPAADWAIFECVGPMPEAIQNLQKRIMTEWLPASGYEYADAPDIEVYPEGDQGADDYRCEVWLPVRKK